MAQHSYWPGHFYAKHGANAYYGQQPLKQEIVAAPLPFKSRASCKAMPAIRFCRRFDCSDRMDKQRFFGHCRISANHSAVWRISRFTTANCRAAPAVRLFATVTCQGTIPVAPLPHADASPECRPEPALPYAAVQLCIERVSLSPCIFLLPAQTFSNTTRCFTANQFQRIRFYFLRHHR